VDPLIFSRSAEDRCHPLVVSELLEVLPGVVLPESTLQWRFSRSSGPGGQHVNTSDTRAELSIDVTQALPEPYRSRALTALEGRLVNGVLTVAASEHRSQLQNRTAATERLVAILRAAASPPPAPRRATKPSRASKERRLQVKRQRSDLKKQRRRPPD
jgi:ribosome-associated protein